MEIAEREGVRGRRNVWGGGGEGGGGRERVSGGIRGENERMEGGGGTAERGEGVGGGGGEGRQEVTRAITISSAGQQMIQIRCKMAALFSSAGLANDPDPLQDGCPIQCRLVTGNIEQTVRSHFLSLLQEGNITQLCGCVQ